MMVQHTMQEKIYASHMLSITNDLVAGKITEEAFIKKAKEKAVFLQHEQMVDAAKAFIEAEENKIISSETSRKKIKEEFDKYEALTTA